MGFKKMALMVGLLAFPAVSFSAEFTQADLCRAMVSATMGRDVSIIHVDRQSGGITHLSYNRPSDNSHWAMRCRLDGNRIIWATDTGRWRTHKLDEVITYEVSGDRLTITQDWGDGSASVDEFTKAQF
ncbi:hypothetical protein [Salinicola socius]|uniref:Uncharacterized protein n=1 Tax=Salinicola socius TaxID=404433 RepID=A0A1Q8SUX7_9GAMM|nr:hypothetical protein [Salinicola socius]OLO05241.1 hypothetical protein BTW07_04220 [Salinicola socius]